MWTREAIRARVDALGRDRSGSDLVEAYRRFGEQLDDGERAILGEVLLERAARERPSLADVRRPGLFERGRRRRRDLRG